ncbi:keratin-associated protein 10-3-like [Sabethes cyaneus]|uniref:keratin-associated protein 10-3-like n=1 Tax=Sabethes cyaneus TaxID=53552 RepID=UPI00237DC8E5|nr:keratin-associated protein 10-3-like [Sabethes cyaneus]
MKYIVLAIALFGVSIEAQAPCTTTICLSQCAFDPRCPATNPLQPVLLPHTDCSRFYKCHNGRACPYNCPAGLHFNRDKNACDWPNQACCDPTIPCRPDPCNGGTGCPVPTPPPTCPPSPCPPTGPGCPPIWCPIPTPQPPQCPPTNCPPVGPGCPPTWCPPPPPPPPPPCPPIICPPPPCGGGGNNCDNCDPHPECPLFNPPKPKLLRHRLCTKFYKCETGRACEMDCPAGLHFNVNRQVCDWPWFACCDPSMECRPNPCDNGFCPPANLPPTCVGWNC